MSAWSELPQELLSTIFENVESNRNLLQLELVCKSWSAVAYKYLYRSICLQKEPSLSLVSTLMKSKHEPRFHVKIVDFGKQQSCKSFLAPSERDDRRLLILCLCPNITHLRVTELAAPEALYKQLLTLRNQGYLQHVQHLPRIQHLRSFQNMTFRDIYNRTAIAMKDNLAHLYIMDKDQYTHDRSALSTSNITLFQHIHEFPHLKELVVLYTASKLLYQTSSWIDQCASTVQRVSVRLNNSGTSLERTRVAKLDIATVQRNDNINDLAVSANIFTMRDFKYIQHKFNGLNKLIIKFSGNLNDDIVSKLAADGILSLQNYTKVFDYLTSLRHFGIIRFPLVSGVDETLAYWSQRPELKEIKIMESTVNEREAILLTMLNTNVPNEMKDFDAQDPENGNWQLTLNVHYQEFNDFYQRILDFFKNNTITKICLASASEEEMYQPATSGTFGDSLGYVMDYYKAVKKLQLQGTKLESFCAETTGRHLDTMEFTACSIKPEALVKLSSSVAYVGQLSFTSCITLDGDMFDIDMPQTTIGALQVDHDYNENCAYLVTLRTSIPAQSIRYFYFGKDKALEVDADQFDELSATGTNGFWYTKVSIRCHHLDTLSTSSDFQCITLGALRAH